MLHRKLFALLAASCAAGAVHSAPVAPLPLELGMSYPEAARRVPLPSQATRSADGWVQLHGASLGVAGLKTAALRFDAQHRLAEAHLRFDAQTQGVTLALAKHYRLQPELQTPAAPESAWLRADHALVELLVPASGEDIQVLFWHQP